MQDIRFIITSDTGILDLLRLDKLYIKNLRYFDSNYESENNKFIISISRYIYYRNIFI